MVIDLTINNLILKKTEKKTFNENFQNYKKLLNLKKIYLYLKIYLKLDKNKKFL